VALSGTRWGRCIMPDHSALGPWIKRFLLEHLVRDRNFSLNTQQSYRDTLCLLLPFASHHCRKEVDRLTVSDLSADIIRAFLATSNEHAIAPLQPGIKGFQGFTPSLALSEKGAPSTCNGAVRSVQFRSNAPKRFPLLASRKKSWT